MTAKQSVAWALFELIKTQVKDNAARQTQNGLPTATCKAESASVGVGAVSGSVWQWHTILRVWPADLKHQHNSHYYSQHQTPRISQKPLIGHYCCVFTAYKNCLGVLGGSTLFSSFS